MSEDLELLRRYAKEHSEAAFAELVRRHVDLVYSAAFRIVNGDGHCAEDVAQQVFAELARKARSLTDHPAFVGWLYTTTRHIAMRMVRADQRRAAREQAARNMSDLMHEPESDWNRLGPVLEEAMHELDEKDRLAVLLRFFKSKSLKDVGAELGLSDNAARMRVDRALDKLRLQLARKGVTSTTAAVAAVLMAHSVSAAPPALATALAGMSVAAATGSGSTLAILKIMSMTKIQAGLAALAVVGLGTAVVTEHRAVKRLARENQALRDQAAEIDTLRAENQSFSAQLAVRTRSSPRAEGPSSELLRLRSQVALLREKTGDFEELQQENERLLRNQSTRRLPELKTNEHGWVLADQYSGRPLPAPEHPLLRPTYELAKTGDLEGLKAHLDQHPEFLNLPVGSAGSTILQTAAFNGQKEVVEELLRRGADVNARNVVGDTPLYDAVKKGAIDITAILLIAGADASASNNVGVTPLDMAMAADRLDLIVLLRQWGAKERSQ